MISTNYVFPRIIKATSDIQGFPYEDAHQLAMVPCHQGIASAGA